MLWLVYLFSGFTAVGRLFDRERSSTRRYLQWTANPLGLMLGKLIHAILTTTALSAIVLCGFLLFLGWPGSDGHNVTLVILAAWLGGLSMTTTLVFVTAVASQIQTGGGALGAILGLPLLLPQLILATRLTTGALHGTPWPMLSRNALVPDSAQRRDQRHRVHPLPVHLARMSNWNALWKFGGILLLAYVIVWGFGTPLQPGLVEASPSGSCPVTPPGIDGGRSTLRDGHRHSRRVHPCAAVRPRLDRDTTHGRGTPWCVRCGSFQPGPLTRTRRLPVYPRIGHPLSRQRLLHRRRWHRLRCLRRWRRRTRGHRTPTRLQLPLPAQHHREHSQSPVACADVVCHVLRHGHRLRRLPRTTPHRRRALGPPRRSSGPHGAGVRIARIGHGIPLGPMDLGRLVGIRPTTQWRARHRPPVHGLPHPPRRHGRR